MNNDPITACQDCPRLANHLAEIRQQYPDYHARPVAAFGDPQRRLFIVGLAPGLHGANATGRPFTGDHAGIILYQTLHRFGFASRPESVASDDGLRLPGCRITNAVKCLPPQNKPSSSEIRNCNHYLAAELEALPVSVVILALGRIAHEAVLRAYGLKLRQYPFAHAAEHSLPVGNCLIDSYHCSRYNTQTRRLTAEMFDGIFKQIHKRLAGN